MDRVFPMLAEFMFVRTELENQTWNWVPGPVPVCNNWNFGGDKGIINIVCWMC